MCRASTLLPAAVDSDDLCTLLVAAAFTALNLVEEEEHQQRTFAVWPRGAFSCARVCRQRQRAVDAGGDNSSCVNKAHAARLISTTD